MKFLRRMAGTTIDPGSYFVPRAHVAPPKELLLKVWPWLTAWELRFRKRARRKNWEQGGLNEDDFAGAGFVKLLLALRSVLLQDLAVLQPGKLPHFAFLISGYSLAYSTFGVLLLRALFRPKRSRFQRCCNKLAPVYAPCDPPAPKISLRHFD
jgi:hypothetical protein